MRLLLNNYLIKQNEPKHKKYILYIINPTCRKGQNKLDCNELTRNKFRKPHKSVVIFIAAIK